MVLPEFEIPEFVEKIDEFIDKAKVLNDHPAIPRDFDHLGIVGIGGSQVQPLVFRPHAKKPVTHLEVPDPYVLRELKKHKDNVQILYLSRSGTTKEVLSCVPYLTDYSSVVVTNGGQLKQIADQMRWPTIPVSFDISGRFAILNELGIVPMIAMGIDPVEFLTHLKRSYDEHFKTGSKAEQVAIALYNLEVEGLAKMRLLPSGCYPQGLAILLTQLINESVPKAPGDELDVSLHIMPRSAHSDVQRWYGGVKDSFIFSLRCQEYSTDLSGNTVSNKLQGLIPGSDASAGEHLNITSLAVEDTFPGPVFKVVLEEDSLAETAQCVGFFHALTVRLCQLKSSDPFNQPAVQQYKERGTQIYKELDRS